MDKSPEAFRTISEVAEALETPAHVLRFWETRFPQIRPVKRAGGRRYYRPSDLALLAGIRRLLHDEGMTIRGVQKILREQGVRHVAGLTDEASAEEEALITAMTSAGKPHEAEVTRLTPREADQASIDALEAEALAAAAKGGAPEAGAISATVIAFPADPASSDAAQTGAPAASPPPDPPKEPAVTAIDPDPRQIPFPGFEAVPGPAEDELIAPAGASTSATPVDAGAEDEEAPFIFDADHDEEPEPASASITQFVPADLPPSPLQAEADADAPESGALPLHTTAARLRALPPGRLHSRNETLRSLARRVRALRNRLDEARNRPN